MIRDEHAMSTLEHTLRSLVTATEPPLPLAGVGGGGGTRSAGRATFLSDAHAIHAGERLADAMARELAPLVSLSRVTIAPMWLEPWAACAPLRHAGPVRLMRTATVLRTKTDLVCIDPCLTDAWQKTPHGERMTSLHPRETAETFPHTLRAAVGPCDPYTEVIFTSVSFQSLRELVGTTHGDGVEEALAPLFPNARIYLGPGALDGPPDDDARPTRCRGGLDRLRTDALTFVERPTLLPSGLVVIPTPGPSPEHLTVAYPILCAGHTERVRVGIVTSSVTTRDAFSPYESSLPGLREHARLRDTDLAPRGDAHDPLAARRIQRFERALADRDPEDPRFHLVHPSQDLRP